MPNDPRDKTPNGTKSNFRCPDCGANLSYTSSDSHHKNGFKIKQSTFSCDGCHNIWRRTEKVKE